MLGMQGTILDEYDWFSRMQYHLHTALIQLAKKAMISASQRKTLASFAGVCPYFHVLKISSALAPAASVLYSLVRVHVTPHRDLKPENVLVHEVRSARVRNDVGFGFEWRPSPLCSTREIFFDVTLVCNAHITALRRARAGLAMLLKR